MRSFSLYQKFALTIILLGLLPMAILATFIANRMIKDYSQALRVQYEQASEYVASGIETLLDSYNTVSKMPYYYNFDVYGAQDSYLSFDHLRQIIYGEGYEYGRMEEDRNRDMGRFLQYIQSVDSYINGVHVLAEDSGGEELSFHYSAYNTFFTNLELFEETVNYKKLDKEGKKLILIPPHMTTYFYGAPDWVFTVARNYFDLRGQVGHTPYVGTIFIDVDLKRMEKLFRSVEFTGNEDFYVVNGEGDCFYSNRQEAIGENVTEELEGMDLLPDRLVIKTAENEYGLSVIVSMDAKTVFSSIRRMQKMMYFILAVSVLALLAGSFYFSKKLTRPMREMMAQMSMVESGRFDIELPIRSKDEIGVLSGRFNEMSRALKKYINQSYVAQIKQNEAELTALKAQIYPHFLYNTLEIIRMTALEEEGRERVPEMIEALSEQIHYLIGPVQDMVTLEKEIDIVRKYVYLLNCRISGRVQLLVKAQGASRIQVPKLILQPIVENAYVHGLKPKKEKGCIMIEAAENEGVFEISVMDNGIGMDSQALEKIARLFESDAPGVKAERKTYPTAGAEPAEAGAGDKKEYNWQSIGLKNVHDRIRFLYGDEYGIQITSTVAVGTMVRILLPLEHV